MHEFECELESSIHDLHISRQSSPKFCNPWGATSVCEQIDMCEKKCNMTCYFTQQVKENMMAKISK